MVKGQSTSISKWKSSIFEASINTVPTNNIINFSTVDTEKCSYHQVSDFWRYIVNLFLHFFKFCFQINRKPDFVPTYFSKICSQDGSYWNGIELKMSRFLHIIPHRLDNAQPGVKSPYLWVNKKFKPTFYFVFPSICTTGRRKSSSQTKYIAS